MDTRVCACKALASLKVRRLTSGSVIRPSVISGFVDPGFFQAKESIEQLVYVCRTDREEVREAAKQTLLVLGEAAFSHTRVCVCVEHVCVCLTRVSMVQGRRARWPTDTWRRPRTAFPGSSPRGAWPAPLSDGPTGAAPPTLTTLDHKRCHDNFPGEPITDGVRGANDLVCQ